MQLFSKSLAFGVVAAILANAVNAAEYTLTISSWAPPTHDMNDVFWPEFIEMVEDATDGRVTAELKLGLAPPPAQIDLVQDGAADISIIFHGYQPGRFVTTKLSELPGYEGSAVASSVAYWRTFETHLAAADEHRGVKVIGLSTHGAAQLHTNAEVTSLDQFSGLKLRVPGGVGGDVAAALGATRIQVPAPKVYETLASGAADGVVMPVSSRTGFKLTEVARNMYLLPGGLYRGSFAMIMNEDAFADLPEDIQKALDEKVFGEPLSRAAGDMWENYDIEALDVTQKTDGNAIFEASDQDIENFAAVSASVQAAVLDEISALGLDAQAAYDMMLVEMAKQ